MFAEVKVPAISVAGTGTGMVAGELVSETFARGTGLTGWNKVIAKGFMKGVIFALGYALSERTAGMMSLFLETFGYGSLGSIFLDVFGALYPGGIWGIAEGIAVSMRGAAVHAEAVVEKFGVVEKVVPSAPAERVEAVVRGVK